jgi:hypothetical protein
MTMSIFPVYDLDRAVQIFKPLRLRGAEERPIDELERG